MTNLLADVFTPSPKAADPPRSIYEPPVTTNELPLFDARLLHLQALDGTVTALRKMLRRLTEGMTDAKVSSLQKHVEPGKHMPQPSIDDPAAAKIVEIMRLLKFGARTAQDRCRVKELVDEQMKFQDSLRNRPQVARLIPPADDTPPSGPAALRAPPPRTAAAHQPLPPTAGGVA